MRSRMEPLALDPADGGRADVRRAPRWGALAAGVSRDRVFAFVVACAIFGPCVGAGLNDPDLGWHLRAGELVWRNGWPPTADPFSFTHPGAPWVDYSWLAELVMWLVATHAGFHLLRILAAGIVTAAFLVVYRTCREAGASTLAAAAVVLLAALASFPFLSVRPAVVSLPLAAVFLRTLARYRRGEPARLWILVPLTVLWVNVHVFFVFGLAWTWATGAWMLLSDRRRATTLLLVALACTATTLLTPFGTDFVRHVAEISRQPATLAVIAEHASPNFHGEAGFLVLPFLLLIMAAVAWSPERPDAFAFMLLLGHTALALYMQRNVLLLAVFAAPVVARAVTRIFPDALADSSSPVAVPHVIAALMALALTLAKVPREAALEANLRPRTFPLAAVRFLEKQPPLGRMMNDYDWGGYLIYALHPRYQVSVDGRTGVYGETTMQAYFDASYLHERWHAYVDGVHPDFVLWKRGEALPVALAATPDWVQVYADELAVILVRADHPLRERLMHAGHGETS